LYVVTNPNSGKVKRIRHTPEVEVAPSDGRGKPLGEPAKAVARILSPEEEALARSALDQKYRLAKRLLNLYSTVRRSPEVHLEITPL
jgi:PPOX class probable F420-dependent enzyme